ncbi:hypothetical protein CsSME_00018703 [Camellia sinensis var. sinensis]
MTKIRAIKSMITGELSDLQPAEIAGGQSSIPVMQDKGVVLALASKQAASRSKKRPRRNETKQHLVDEDFVELSSTDLGK